MTLAEYSALNRKIKEKGNQQIRNGIKGIIHKLDGVLYYSHDGVTTQFFNAFMIKDNGEIWAVMSRDKNGNVDFSLNCWYIAHIANVALEGWGGGSCQQIQ